MRSEGSAVFMKVQEVFMRSVRNIYEKCRKYL
jgi:hypothetical protein